jgi:hypothetical protein
VQRFALRLEDGRLAELESAIRRSVEEFPTRPLFGCLLARLLAELGDEDGASPIGTATMARSRFSRGDELAEHAPGPAPFSILSCSAILAPSWAGSTCSRACARDLPGPRRGR